MTDSVMKLIWPSGIPPEEYEAAILLLNLLQHIGAPTKTHTGSEGVYSAAGAAEYLGLPRSTVYSAIKAGELKAEKSGDGTLQIPRASLDEYRTQRASG